MSAPFCLLWEQIDTASPHDFSRTRNNLLHPTPMGSDEEARRFYFHDFLSARCGRVTQERMTVHAHKPTSLELTGMFCGWEGLQLPSNHKEN